MELIKVRVNGACAQTVYCKTITSGMVGAEVTFEYVDPVWDSLLKTAVFWAGDVTKDVVNISSTVKIPPEVLAAFGRRLKIGVYGVSEDGTLTIPTLWADVGIICPGTDPSGDESTDPTPAVWTQILNLMGAMENLNTEDKSTLVAAINEALTKCCGEADPEEIQRIVNEYLKENSSAIGADGKSAYDYAVDGGYDGSEEDFAKKMQAEYLPVAGGTMTGPINMNGQKLSGLNSPTASDEAATKGYADTKAPIFNIGAFTGNINAVGGDTGLPSGVDCDCLCRSTSVTGTLPIDGDYTFALSIRRYSGAFTQKAITYPRMEEYARFYINSAWTDWVKISGNLTLTAGAERITGETWLGKPVYTMLLDCGAASNGKEVEYGLTGQTLIRGMGVIGAFVSPRIHLTVDNANSCWIEFWNQKLFIHCGANVESNAYQTYAQIWYTKG